MKKIHALSLMFVVFAPFNAFAACVNGQEWNGVNAWVSCTSGSGSSASAATGAGLSGGTGNLTLLVSFLQDALIIATGLILAAAIVFFLWGVAQFVRSAGDEEARKTGKNHIIYGIIGIAVMVSMWGLVNFLTGSADLVLDAGVVPALPEMPA